eukprot:TRINITY_DN1631_c0_g1_i2.p1 TRINITY_DN1631_c0_g1~~TRINITY_DN1631_c0_g1_i2.p1  ORF type:complete len:709 (+),score=161.45 TRINITY_DN1631_c0_g1_i2:245-2128(+)
MNNGINLLRSSTTWLTPRMSKWNNTAFQTRSFVEEITTEEGIAKRKIKNFKEEFNLPFDIRDETDERVIVTAIEQAKFKKWEQWNPEDYGLKLNEAEKITHDSYEKLKKMFWEDFEKSSLSREEWMFTRGIDHTQTFVQYFIAGEGEKMRELADRAYGTKSDPREEEERQLLLPYADAELKQYLTGIMPFAPEERKDWNDQNTLDEADRALMGSNPSMETLFEFQKRKYQRKEKDTPWVFLSNAKLLRSQVDYLIRVREKKRSLLEQIQKGIFETHSLIDIKPAQEFAFDEESVDKWMMLDMAQIREFLPEGISGDMGKEHSYLHQGEKVAFLFRRRTLQLIERLKAARKDHFLHSSPYIMLDGDTGSGKSTMLNQVVYWARRSGWLVLFVPDGNYWVNGKYWLEESNREPGMINTPLIAQPWCHALWQAHRQQLSTIKLRLETSDMPQFDRNPNSTLADLVEYGYKNLDFSCDAVYHIRREFNLITEYPVLMVVDGVNHMFHRSDFGNPLTTKVYPGEPLYPHQMVLPKTFSNYRNHGLANGTALVTVSRRSGVSMRSFESQVKHHPKTVFDVPIMNNNEFENWLLYVEQYGGLFKHVPGGQRSAIYALSGGRPNDAFQYLRRRLL